MFAQQWPRLRQQVKAWWDRLTDVDLEQIAGNKEQLIRAIQARYAYARERVEQEVDRRLAEVSDRMEAPGANRLAEAATSSAHELASEMTKRAGEAGSTAQKMATTAATSVADTVARAGAFLPELPSGLAGLIRRYPVPSLMVGMGLGFLLGRSLARTWGPAAGEESRHQSEAGFPEAIIQCSRCGQMVRQADMVSHSATCSGPGLPSHGGSPA
jgi:uncharacterized protein YjbJ (UPF0337 family)